MAPIDPSTSALGAVQSQADASAKFVARQFRAEDLEQVLVVFAEGMREYPEHQDNADVEGYIRNSLDTDLSDIHGTYMARGGNFWVITPAHEPSLVVGMVGLEAMPRNECELRRMSVRRDYRRFGIGRLLLITLDQWAREQGVKKLWFMTGGAMKKAQAFYAASGYTLVEMLELPDNKAFPRVAQFEKLMQ